MFIPTSLFFILFITIIQSQNITVQFPKFPVNTDIGSCTCDLTQNTCDISCCCDSDCSPGDRQVFECNSRENQYTNSSSVISTVQPTCFKNISIFKSNSPYIIQKMGELVCVDYERYQGSQYYQQPNIQTLDPNSFIQNINTQYSVSVSPTLPTTLTNYQVGTPILTNKTTNNASRYYSLPVNLFNDQLCAGSQTITYMNNFTSTCSQIVDSSTCTGALNPMTYMNPLCLLPSPSNFNGISNNSCDYTTANPSTFGGTTCTGALQSLTVRIYYQNPNGIVHINLTNTIANALNSTFEQTFAVYFIKIGSSSSSTTRSPGYLQGANIIAGTASGSTIDTTISSLFSILKPSSTGFCDVNSRTPIRFGENIRSACKYTLPASAACPDLHNYFIPTNSSNLYIAAYSNPDPSNSSNDWLPAISYLSDIGSTTTRGHQNGIIVSTDLNGICYVKLDIQISYTNIGSIFNPQPVLSAVIFHYQGVADNSLNATTTLLVMESVTFQDISSAPTIAEGQIPTPNTRLPANFFYPFSDSRGTKSVTFSSLSYLLMTTVLFTLV